GPPPRRVRTIARNPGRVRGSEEVEESGDARCGDRCNHVDQERTPAVGLPRLRTRDLPDLPHRLTSTRRRLRGRTRHKTRTPPRGSRRRPRKSGRTAGGWATAAGYSGGPAPIARWRRG